MLVEEEDELMRPTPQNGSTEKNRINQEEKNKRNQFVGNDDTIWRIYGTNK